MVQKKIGFALMLSALLISMGSSCFAASAMRQKMDTYMKAWEAEDLFSGAVLVAKDDQIIFQKAYGKADYGKDIVNTIDTRFRTGSLTKAFTALAVLQLEQKGLLDVNDSLNKYMPDYPRGKEITLEMLLNHRSGIMDHTTLADYNTRRRTEPCSLEETIERDIQKPAFGVSTRL